MPTTPTTTTASDISRRCDRSRHVPAEQAITEAMAAVEAMPADVRLTDAVTLLGAARDSVADFVDGVPRKDQPGHVFTIPCASPAPTEVKTCCKCDAYREIIKENAAEIATLHKLLVSHRERAGWAVDEIDKAIGKKVS